MKMDIIAITALIVAVGGIITQIITSAHIKSCHSCLCDSECMTSNSKNNTPLETKTLILK
jgi:hypothetical protein